MRHYRPLHSSTAIRLKNCLRGGAWHLQCSFDAIPRRPIFLVGLGSSSGFFSGSLTVPVVLTCSKRRLQEVSQYWNGRRSFSSREERAAIISAASRLQELHTRGMFGSRGPWRRQLEALNNSAAVEVLGERLLLAAVSAVSACHSATGSTPPEAGSFATAIIAKISSFQSRSFDAGASAYISEGVRLLVLLLLQPLLATQRPARELLVESLADIEPMCLEALGDAHVDPDKTRIGLHGLGVAGSFESSVNNEAVNSVYEVTRAHPLAVLMILANYLKELFTFPSVRDRWSLLLVTLLNAAQTLLPAASSESSPKAALAAARLLLATGCEETSAVDINVERCVNLGITALRLLRRTCFMTCSADNIENASAALFILNLAIVRPKLQVLSGDETFLTLAKVVKTDIHLAAEARYASLNCQEVLRVLLAALESRCMDSPWLPNVLKHACNLAGCFTRDERTVLQNVLSDMLEIAENNKLENLSTPNLSMPSKSLTPKDTSNEVYRILKLIKRLRLFQLPHRSNISWASGRAYSRMGI